MPAKARTGWLLLGGLALTHGLSDFYGMTFAPLVQTFREQFALDQAQVGAIAAVVGVFGSMVQPLFGLWGERRDRGLLAAVGLLVSAAFMGAIGAAPNVYALCVLLTLGALGVAAFHPAAATLATGHVRKRSLAMAVFIAGGGVGMALAPLVVPWVARRFGLRNLWLIALPGVAVAVWLYAATRGVPRPRPAARRFDLRAAFAPGTGPVWALLGMALLRSLVVTAFIVFATVLGAGRGWDLTTSGQFLSVFMAAVFTGGLLGGYLGQRTSQRAVLAVSSLLCAPLFYAFALPDGAGWLSGPLAPLFADPRRAAFLVLFGGAGFTFGVGSPLNVSLAQELRPQSAAMVSGLMMGLAWGLANVLLIPVGLLAKHQGIEWTLQLVASVGGAAALFSLLLPSRRAAAKRMA